MSITDADRSAVLRVNCIYIEGAVCNHSRGCHSIPATEYHHTDQSGPTFLVPGARRFPVGTTVQVNPSGSISKTNSQFSLFNNIYSEDKLP
jgi:hypothetical protein